MQEEKTQERWDRFRGHSSELSIQRQRHDAKLNKKFKDIETRNSQRRASLTYSTELQKELVSQRERDAKMNQAHNKAVLDCIKERIWRKHKKV